MSILLSLLGTFFVTNFDFAEPPSEPKDPITFGGKKFVHRFSKGDLHEYTPTDQKVLKRFKDMLTINVYPKSKSGEDLAGNANSVLETYKAHGAVVVSTNSVPRTEDRPAEHLVVVLFPRPDFIEASFARFKLQDGKGVSIVYSHRIYDKKAGDAMNQWLKANGQAKEKALMSLKFAIPK